VCRPVVGAPAKFLEMMQEDTRLLWLEVFPDRRARLLEDALVDREDEADLPIPWMAFMKFILPNMTNDIVVSSQNHLSAGKDDRMRGTTARNGRPSTFP
jgi:hypothetical protein